MSPRTLRLALASTLLVPVFAGPARANSITTYGIIITAIGNELQVQPVDKPSDGAGAVPATEFGDKGGSLMVTSNGAGGISVTPYSGSNAGGTTSPGKGATGNTDGSTPDGTKDDDIQVEDPPVLVEFPEPSPTDSVDTGDPVKDEVEVTDPPILTAAPTTGANTPEPASLTLLSLAGLGGLYARRRRK